MRYGVVAILGLCACVPVNPITAVRLAASNPLEADPGNFAVRVDLPDGVGVVPGSAALGLQTTNATGEEINATYPLTRDAAGAWRLVGGALDRLRTDQAQAIAWEAVDPTGTSGSFSAGFEPCAIGPGPGPDAATSLSLQITPDGPFLPLVEDALIADLYGANSIASLPPCTTDPRR